MGIRGEKASFTISFSHVLIIKVRESLDFITMSVCHFLHNYELNLERMIGLSAPVDTAEDYQVAVQHIEYKYIIRSTSDC